MSRDPENRRRRMEKSSSMPRRKCLSKGDRKCDGNASSERETEK